MKTEELQAIAQQAANSIKTEQDLNEFRQMLSKITIEVALNAELDDHLGYSKHEKTDSDNRVEMVLPAKHSKLKTANLS